MYQKIAVYKDAQGRLVIETAGRIVTGAPAEFIADYYAGRQYRTDDRVTLQRDGLGFSNMLPEQIVNGTGAQISSPQYLENVKAYFEGLGVGVPDSGAFVSVETFNAALAAVYAAIGGGTTPTQLATPKPSATAATTSITISWPAVPNATSYTLKRNGTIVYTGPLLSFTDMGLTASTGYTYTLTASATGYLTSAGATVAATTLDIVVPDPGNNSIPYTIPFTLAA